MQVLVDGLGNGSPGAVFVSGSTNFNTFFPLKFYGLFKLMMETGQH